MMNIISLEEVKYLPFSLARRHLSFDEKIPEFSTRFPHILESCLATPFQKFRRKSLYPSLVDKAAILFYLMIKNHPFQNGNKRIAITTLLYFLYKNNYWLKVDIQSFYNFTVWVASSPAPFKKETVAAIKKFISANLIKLGLTDKDKAILPAKGKRK
jgi:death-on-curing family protein